MPKKLIGLNVFDAALERLKEIYNQGHRVVVSFSGGKDSGICIEMCLLAAEATGRLPVDVIMRDEEIMLPGTFEYCERIYKRPGVRMDWLKGKQPIINIFNRASPYYWAFDPLLKHTEWMRQPPPFTKEFKTYELSTMVVPERYPVEKGQDLIAVLGLRASESPGRNMGIMAAKSALTKANSFGVKHLWAIYDWRDGDVWKAIKDNKWDYNDAYNVMHRMGIPRRSLRIAPPCLNEAGIPALQVAAKAWPQWFDKLCIRLPGTRAAAYYGKRAVLPYRKLGETWEQTYQRENIDEAPAWIAARATYARDFVKRAHGVHSTQPIPDIKPCLRCRTHGSWRNLTKAIYLGDPLSLKTGGFVFTRQDGPPELRTWIDPDYFRPGSGFWETKPIW
jgi:predicted phosphoadenosine phosphosulfate sulfurtransferase